MRPIHHGASGAVVAYLTDYLTKAAGEPPGQWAGRQAGALGLVGEVSAEQLQSLLEGTHPITHSTLGAPFSTRYTRDGKPIPSVIGFDATFSAPKSLSVLWALTGDDGLAECHDVAVHAAIESIERRAATTRVRSNGTRMYIDTEGLTTAVFRQSTSRADDPQLHSHVVISSKVRAPDGRWRALDARQLMKHQSTFGRVYQSVLRAEVTQRYGVGWTEIINGQAEIAGIPSELLEVFSKRAEQIGHELADRIDAFRLEHDRDPSRYERSAIEREVAADTRDSKSGAAASDLRTRWRAEAEAIGVRVDRLMPAARAQLDDRGALPSVDVVLHGVGDQRSSWQHLDVIRYVAETTRPPADIDGRQWATTLDRLASDTIDASISLDAPTDSPLRRRSDGRSVWADPIQNHATGEHILAQEEAILTWAMEAQLAPTAPSAAVDQSLDIGQRDAAAAIAGHGPLVLVVGPAGAGKTTMLRSASADLSLQHRNVIGLAPTAKAARVLQAEAWMPSVTVAKLLHDLEHRPDGFEPPAPGTTLVVDEAGMVNTDDLYALVDHSSRRGWRLALIGDPEQLHAVGRGGMFDELCATGRPIHLDHIHRFRHDWEADASLGLRRGDSSAIDAYVDRHCVIAGFFDEHLDTVVDEWRAHHDAGRTLAITTTRNDDVNTINDRIQRDRMERGEIGNGAIAMIATGIACVGDVVTTRRNDRRILTSDGDHVRNRDRWIVTGVGSDGGLDVVDLAGRRTANLPGAYVDEHVQLAYASTEHGAQGETADVGLTIVTDATTRRGLYVGTTRGRDYNLILTVAYDIDEAIERLNNVLVSDRADIPATVQRRRLLHEHGREEVDDFVTGVARVGNRVEVDRPSRYEDASSPTIDIEIDM